MPYILISVVIAGLTYVSLQTEVAYFATDASFYINMCTHFLGGAFTASGTLAIRSVINQIVAYIEPHFERARIFGIPHIPIMPLILIVLIVGLVWEVWEFSFRESTLMSIDTLKDVIMDMLGAYCIGALFGRYQHD
jgi:hypothetical protein